MRTHAHTHTAELYTAVTGIQAPQVILFMNELVELKTDYHVRTLPRFWIQTESASYVYDFFHVFSSSRSFIHIKRHFCFVFFSFWLPKNDINNFKIYRK